MTWQTDLGNWDCDCDRCGEYAHITCATRSKQKEYAIEAGWTFKHNLCYCPKCTELMQAWADTKARISTYLAQNVYTLEEETQIKGDLDIVEKQLNL